MRKDAFARWQSVGEVVEVESGGGMVQHEFRCFVGWKVDGSEAGRVAVGSSEVPKYWGMCEQEKGNENEPFEVFYLQIQAKMKITAAPAALKATKDRLSGFSGMT